MSIYGPVFAMARYSPSCEKLMALMAFLGKDDIASAQSSEQIIYFRTYSQAVMVRAQIHSDKSNMLTIESYPPEARYL